VSKDTKNTDKMKENLEKIANWWVNQATNVSLNWNNGDDSRLGGLSFLLANHLANSSRQNITNEQREKFKNHIVEKGMIYFEEKGYLPDLSVDYSPSPFLWEAAESANIPPTAFPCKSHTLVINGVALGACGYGKPLAEIVEMDYA